MTNKRQAKYIENRARGMSREQSAILAGYPADQKAGERVEEQPTVANELARIRAEMANSSGVTKEDIVRMLQEAAILAKMQGDAAGLVGAARELGKMLGFYAPEVKKTLHGVDKQTLKKALAEMTDEELYRIAQARPIDGESKRLPEPGTDQKV